MTVELIDELLADAKERMSKSVESTRNEAVGEIFRWNIENHTKLGAQVRRTMAARDRLLMGVDLRKDRATLEQAYDDCQGVTARFNLNLLSRIAERVTFVLIPPLLLIFLVLGTIFLGIATPTEASATGMSSRLPSR